MFKLVFDQFFSYNCSYFPLLYYSIIISFYLYFVAFNLSNSSLDSAATGNLRLSFYKTFKTLSVEILLLFKY